MIYKLEKNIIYVLDKTQFNPEHILECGQVFRFGKDGDGNYFVISKCYKATIIEDESCYKILSNNPEYFIEYFDLNTDYNEIKNKLSNNKVLSKMIEHGYGIRILKGDPEEMIYSFIISQNNNIKRIQKIIEKLCEAGDTIENFKSFPSTKTLSSLPMDFYKNLGAGYRDTFLFETSRALLNINIDELKAKSTEEIYSSLLKFKGIGPKVASCILLFGFSRMEKFPVDTWIEQVYYNHFSNEKRSRPQIQTYFENEFKEYSGIAQQYLFFYERESK